MLPHHTDRAIWIVITILLFLFVGNFIFTQYEFSQLKNNLQPKTPQPIVFATLMPVTPAPSTSPTATPIPTPGVNQAPTPTIPPTIKITYLPLTGGSTQSTDWVSLPGSQFTLTIGDYGAKAYAVWDANLHVDNANGTTFARLYDTTHNIAVNGSEISVTNTSASTDITSGGLGFWQGNNTYVVQLKSLNSSTAFMDSGRIKINY